MGLLAGFLEASNYQGLPHHRVANGWPVRRSFRALPGIRVRSTETMTKMLEQRGKSR